MTNAILVNLISRYETVAYTHNYVFGFTYNGIIYYLEKAGLSFGIKLDRASSKCGGGYSIRYNPTKTEKKTLVESGVAKVLCTVAYFDDLKANSKYNKGEIFEKLITEKFGLEWEKDNVPFFKGADIETNGKAYSVKFEKATVCTESTLVKLGV